MKFTIDSKIFETFPGLSLGLVVCKNIDNSGTAEEVASAIQAEAQRIGENFNAETFFQQPKIDCWRKAYAAFGGEPKKNRSSVENLYKMVLNGVELRSISKVVDIYNYISLKHMLPLGGEDLDKMQGDLVLGFASNNEPAVLLLGEKEPRAPRQGEVIYKDGISAICRRWNWREADRTKLTEETKNCILVVEGLPPVSGSEVETATVELKEMVQKHCGGNLNHFILNSELSDVEL